jgi:hypothetical protein
VSSRSECCTLTNARPYPPAFEQEAIYTLVSVASRQVKFWTLTLEPLDPDVRLRANKPAATTTHGYGRAVSKISSKWSDTYLNGGQRLATSMTWCGIKTQLHTGPDVIILSDIGMEDRDHCLILADLGRYKLEANGSSFRKGAEAQDLTSSFCRTLAWRIAIVVSTWRTLAGTSWRRTGARSGRGRRRRT